MYIVFSAQRYGAAALFAGGLLLAVGGESVLGEQPGAGKCRADVEKYCSGMEPGDGRVMQCLHENREELSTECREVLERREKLYEGFQANCSADAKQFCGDALGGKELRACMKENLEHLSPECRTFLSEFRKQPG